MPRYDQKHVLEYVTHPSVSHDCSAGVFKSINTSQSECRNLGHLQVLSLLRYHISNLYFVKNSENTCKMPRVLTMPMVMPIYFTALRDEIRHGPARRREVSQSEDDESDRASSYNSFPEPHFSDEEPEAPKLGSPKLESKEITSSMYNGDCDLGIEAHLL